MDLSWTSDTVKMRVDIQCNRKMKAHSEKLINVSDMQVPDEDDRLAAQPPPHDHSTQRDRERANLDAQFPFRQQTGKS